MITRSNVIVMGAFDIVLSDMKLIWWVRYRAYMNSREFYSTFNCYLKKWLGIPVNYCPPSKLNLPSAHCLVPTEKMDITIDLIENWQFKLNFANPKGETSLDTSRNGHIAVLLWNSLILFMDIYNPSQTSYSWNPVLPECIHVYSRCCSIGNGPHVPIWDAFSVGHSKI